MAMHQWGLEQLAATGDLLPTAQESGSQATQVVKKEAPSRKGSLQEVEFGVQ
jgi:hypothetical protein